MKNKIIIDIDLFQIITNYLKETVFNYDLIAIYIVKWYTKYVHFYENRFDLDVHLFKTSFLLHILPNTNNLQ